MNRFVLHHVSTLALWDLRIARPTDRRDIEEVML